MTSYTGFLTDGNKSGFGKLELQNKVYIGFFSNDLPHGLGYEVFTDGRKYFGEFIDGKKHGYGHEWIGNDISYKGEWSHGTPHGIGVFKSFKQEEKPALFNYGAIVQLEDRVPQEMFEFFNENNAAVFLEESEEKLKDIHS
jgi:hypothetical protein